MKCLNCGHNDLIGIRLLTKPDGNRIENVNTLACAKCGFIHWFADEGVIKQKLNERDQFKREEKLRKENEEKKINNLSLIR